MSVSVLVPYRGDDGGWRDQAWDFMQAWWRREYPTYQVIQATCPPGPWCKADAVANALRRASSGILIVADADVMCDGVGLAVEAVQAGAASWAVPHWRVNRLTAEATRALYAGGELPPVPQARRRHHRHREPAQFSPEIERSYSNIAIGGGLVVLALALYERVPLDPRFRGWGQEDLSWGLALTRLAGEPMRGQAQLWHLWHPPQERITPGIGSRESDALHYRYTRALYPEAMTALLQEIPR